jgi:hypothetical protein
MEIIKKKIVTLKNTIQKSPKSKSKNKLRNTSSTIKVPQILKKDEMHQQSI